MNITIQVERDLYTNEWVASASDFDPESPMGRGVDADAAAHDLIERLEDQAATEAENREWWGK